MHICNISGIWQQSADECTLVAVTYPGVIIHTTPMLKKKKSPAQFELFTFFKYKYEGVIFALALRVLTFCSFAEEIFLRQIFMLINQRKHESR